MAFSGCFLAELGLVSIRITFDKSRFRAERSFCWEVSFELDLGRVGIP